jgi:hypothetical protein
MISVSFMSLVAACSGGENTTNLGNCGARSNDPLIYSASLPAKDRQGGFVELVSEGENDTGLVSNTASILHCASGVGATAELEFQEFANGTREFYSGSASAISIKDWLQTFGDLKAQPNTLSQLSRSAQNAGLTGELQMFGLEVEGAVCACETFYPNVDRKWPTERDAKSSQSKLNAKYREILEDAKPPQNGVLN